MSTVARACVVLTPRVTIAPSALRELRDRMARFDYRTGVSITGPYAQDPRAQDATQEDVVLSVEMYRDALRVYEIDA